VLTELDLPYELRSAGKGSTRRAELAQITGGSTQCPFLIDPNSNAEMGESKDIIQYLYKTYALYTPPSELLGNVSNVITPVLKPIFKTLAPLQAGSNSDNKSEYDSDIASAKAEIEKEIKSETVVIYTYSLSPFCTEAVGVLQNLGGVQFKEISLGAEWLPFLINEGGAQKRVALAEMTGQSSLPHVFVNGESIGGLYEGLLPALEDGRFFSVMQKSTDSTEISGEEVEN
jgi:glutaredoxin